jgi:ABC-type Na+ efflux pump permease subunit
MRLAARLFHGRFWALALKELRQIRRDRRLTISLIVPPTLQILLFGFALDPDVRALRLGVVDESRTAESRELISTINENRTFELAGSYPTAAALAQALGAGQLDVRVVVPYDFASDRARGQPVTVQVLLNAVNANTAQIALGSARSGPPHARRYGRATESPSTSTFSAPSSPPRSSPADALDPVPAIVEADRWRFPGAKRQPQLSRSFRSGLGGQAGDLAALSLTCSRFRWRSLGATL